MDLTTSQIISFSITFFEKIDGISSPEVPYIATPLASLKEVSSKPKALERVAREWLPDILSHTQDWSIERRKAANDVLLQANAPSLEAVWAYNNKKLKKIMERGLIQNRAEYDICKAAVEDYSEAFSEQERVNLDLLMLNYEKF